MALRQTSRTRQFAWFIIDSRLWWDKDGWMFWLRIPLCGLTIHKNWTDWLYIDSFKTSIEFGLICRQMADEGGMMYIWNWEHVWSRKPMKEFHAANSA
jgi:hypothetical protein